MWITKKALSERWGQKLTSWKLCLYSCETILLQSALPKIASQLQTNNSSPSVCGWLHFSAGSHLSLRPTIWERLHFPWLRYGGEGHGESSPGTKQANVADVVSGTCAHFSMITFVGHYRIHVKLKALRKATMGGLAGFWSCTAVGQKITCVFKA